MERRTFLESTITTGTLLTTADYMGGDSESQPTVDTGTDNETGNSTTGETTIEAEPVEVPSPELAFCTSSGILRVIHMGDERVTDEGTDGVYVTVDNEYTATWVADGDEGGEFLVPVSSFPEIESAEGGPVIEIVWVGDEDTEEVLATHEVGAGEATTAMTTNEAVTNETTTNEITTNETTTTTATEVTTSSGNKTSN